MVFEAIGTRWQIEFNSGISKKRSEFIFGLIKTKIDEFDKTYSRFKSDSWVGKMAKQKGKYVLPEDGLPLLSLYFKLNKLTRGKFTPLIGQVLVDAGYDENYSLRPKALKNPLQLEEVLLLDKKGLTLNNPCLLDFGAAGKGYLADLVSDILESNGVESYCVDAGGDIRIRSDFFKTSRVGLEDPDNPEKVIGVAEIRNESICASAGNRRKWDRFHHIIDPDTLSSTFKIYSTWVVAKTTMLADAMATCLFLVAPEILLKEYEFEYVILYSDFSVKKSDGFRGVLFVK
jgi:thiamine biosynthesis lipoprotein